MNQELVQENQRDIQIVTAELNTLCTEARKTAVHYAIEIGRRLAEAKSILPHGQWGEWLKGSTEFSQSSANNFMRIFSEYGSDQMGLFGTELNSQTFANLSYSKALKLLAMPEEERESFAEEHNVEELSNRELDKLIRERDEALKKAARVKEMETEKEALEEQKNSADALAGQYEKQAEELAEQLSKAKDAEKKAKAKLKELKDNPEVPDEVLKRLQTEAMAAAAEKSAADIQSKTEEANQKLSELRTLKESAEREAKAAQEKIEAMRKEQKASNPEIAAFKVVFNQTQDNLQKLSESIKKIGDGDSETAAKLCMALGQLIRKYAPPEENSDG